MTSPDPRERLIEALTRSTVALDRVEPLLERCEALLLAEANAVRNARTWGDVAKAITSSGPLMALVASVGTLAVNVLGLWLLGYAPPVPVAPEPESHVVAPAGASHVP